MCSSLSGPWGSPGSGEKRRQVTRIYYFRPFLGIGRNLAHCDKLECESLEKLGICQLYTSDDFMFSLLNCITHGNKWGITSHLAPFVFLSSWFSVPYKWFLTMGFHFNHDLVEGWKAAANCQGTDIVRGQIKKNIFHSKLKCIKKQKEQKFSFLGL